MKRVLISVFDKTGIVEFAKSLDSMGWEIISTGGTSKKLKEEGIKVQDISDLTKFPECFDGRVKTLHPNVEGGILADAAGGSRRVNGHEFLVGHLAGAPADAAGLAIGQDLRAAGGALPGGGGAGIGVDGEVVISLPGNGFRHTDTHSGRGRSHFDRKAAAGKGRGGFLGDGGGDIVLEEGGIAEVGAVGSGTALRGEVDFFHGGISFRGV